MPPPLPAASLANNQPTAMQVRGWVDEAAAAAALLGQTVFAARPGVHAVHIAAEMVPLAKVRWLGRGVRVADGRTDRRFAWT